MWGGERICVCNLRNQPKRVASQQKPYKNSFQILLVNIDMFCFFYVVKKYSYLFKKMSFQGSNSVFEFILLN